jgi:hypothetical protein
MDICLHKKIITKSVKALASVVQTTSCPASSESLFISAVIGTVETASGVPYKAIRAGKSRKAKPNL